MKYLLISFLSLLLFIPQSNVTTNQVTITKTLTSDTALDINSDGNMGDWALRIKDDQGLPRGQFNAAGAYYTNSWVVVSGVACKEMLLAQPCTPSNFRPVPASVTPHMLSVWGDTADVILSRAANLDPNDAYLFRGLTWAGAFVNGWWEGKDSFAIRADGTLFWGRQIGRKSHDTSLSSPAPGVLSTSAIIEAGQLSLGEDVSWTRGNGAPTHLSTVGSLYSRLDGGVNTTLYVYTSGGWIAK